MTNRRQFIQSGLALSAASLPVSALAGAASTTSSPALRLERFVVDTRVPAAVELATRAATRAIAVAETSGDLTDLWRSDLAARWKRAPMALAGATTRAGLFVLETLANDHGMRVVYRGIHERFARDSARHVLSGPASVLAHAARTEEPLWAALCGAMAACPLGRTPAARLELEREAGGLDGAEPLVTWIIAPRAALTARA